MTEVKAIESQMVKEFVANSHGNLSRVKELLAQEPGLVNACWDWGGGDWETGLGAAAHTGQREIAELLLAAGARIDLFAAAMLGKIEIVKAILADDPSLSQAKGPHGIPLLVHALAGGEGNGEMVEFLNGLGSVRA
jgi:hypothetical protein